MKSTKKCEAPTVAFIGCGPSGMSFLHAVALRKLKMEEEGDVEGLSKLPIVTCFERAPEPGGVWRSQRAYLNDKISTSCAESSTDESSCDGEDRDIDKIDSDGEASTLTKYFSVEENETQINIEESCHQTDSGSVSSDSSEYSDSSSDSSYNYLEDQCSQALKKKGGAGQSTNHVGTNMYEALWTNGPKEGFEYFDYTFEDHFKHSLPVFMPRQYLLEYMTKRVTRNNPHIFSNHVRFNTQVDYICYNEITKKFEITIEDLPSKETSTLNFDKCIWGAGENGIENIPQSMRYLLQKHNFQGRQMHSSTAGSCLNLVKGKRVFLVGDSFSAEDLALQAVKLGADKVYILTRSGNGVCNDTTSWPGNKVEVLADLAVTGVIQDGHGLRLSEAKFNVKKCRLTHVPGGKTMDLEDISMIIYCTGYQINFAMIDPMLTVPYIEYHDEMYPVDDSLVHWEMAPNALSQSFDDEHTEPNKYLESDTVDVFPGIYRGILVSNPNMMFLKEGNCAIPLFELDVRAWFFLNHIIGDFELPSAEELEQANLEIVKKGMDIPSIRFYLDFNYQYEWKKLGKKHWINDYNNPKTIELDKDATRFLFKLLAQEQIDGAYPFTIGTGEKLNEKGELLLNLNHLSYNGRTASKNAHSDWKTFRDIDPAGFMSLHTGNKAVPLKSRWIDLDDHDPSILKT